MAVLATLSAGVRKALGRPAEDQQQALDRFCMTIAGLRDEAVKARRDSGIEDIWLACEEAYLGIDEQNRNDIRGARWMKPPTMTGPLRSTANDGSVKSAAFVRLTARYVDVAAAKIGEITLPVDDQPFKLDATPVPELIAGLEDDRPVMGMDGAPEMRPAGPEDVGVEPGAPVPVKRSDIAKKQQEMADDAADKATERISDWLVECKHTAQMRKVEFDMARLGAGVLKGPVPKRVQSKSISKKGGAVALELVDKTVPVTAWVDLWNFFPAADCGENIHDGSYLLERDYMSTPALRKLKRQPGYLPDAIDRVIEEGPDKCFRDDAGRLLVDPALAEKKVFTIWYFYGEVERDDFARLNPGQAGTVPAEQQSVFAIVTMVNDTAIKAIINPLDSGSFPYHVASWRRRAGSWAGVGISEQVSLPQKSINAAVRAMFNNAGKSSDPTVVIDRACIVPADGIWNQTPGKIYFKNADAAATDDVSKAFAYFETPNTTAKLMMVIEFAYRLAEESTSIPLITQGQSGDTAPDTLGGQQLQNNNANQLLRDVGFGVADNITNPLIEQCYEWLLLDPDVPEDCKGDFNVNCNAAAAMIERAIQDLVIMQMGAMVVNPAFGVDPKKWFAEMAKTKRLDPRAFQFTEEELAKQAANQAPPVPISVAQIKAESAEKVAAGHDQVTVAKSQIDTDRDTVYVQAEQERSQATHDAKMAELALKASIAEQESADSNTQTLDKIKADLAALTLKLNTQIMLSQQSAAAEITKPPTEPAGQAPDGESYEK